MNRRMVPDHSLNAPVRIDGEGEWQDWLVDGPRARKPPWPRTRELRRRSRLLDRAMNTLNARERRILRENGASGRTEPTLETSRAEFNISRERVRQIEVRAFERFRRAIRNAAIGTPDGGIISSRPSVSRSLG